MLSDFEKFKGKRKKSKITFWYLYWQHLQPPLKKPFFMENQTININWKNTAKRKFTITFIARNRNRWRVLGTHKFWNYLGWFKIRITVIWIYPDTRICHCSDICNKYIFIKSIIRKCIKNIRIVNGYSRIKRSIESTKITQSTHKKYILSVINISKNMKTIGLDRWLRTIRLRYLVYNCYWNCITTLQYIKFRVS